MSKKQTMVDPLHLENVTFIREGFSGGESLDYSLRFDGPVVTPQEGYNLTRTGLFIWRWDEVPREVATIDPRVFSGVRIVIDHSWKLSADRRILGRTTSVIFLAGYEGRYPADVINIPAFPLFLNAYELTKEECLEPDWDFKNFRLDDLKVAVIEMEKPMHQTLQGVTK